MKIYSLLLSFLLLINIVLSQTFDINFENQTPYLINDSTSIWQVGEPNKTIFNEAYFSLNAIITDTVNTYPSNDSSSFIIAFTPIYCTAPVISFYHKYDTDSAKDGCYIEYSIDHGREAPDKRKEVRPPR